MIRKNTFILAGGAAALTVASIRFLTPAADAVDPPPAAWVAFVDHLKNSDHAVFRLAAARGDNAHEMAFPRYFMFDASAERVWFYPGESSWYRYSDLWLYDQGQVSKVDCSTLTQHDPRPQPWGPLPQLMWDEVRAGFPNFTLQHLPGGTYIHPNLEGLSGMEIFVEFDYLGPGEPVDITYIKVKLGDESAWFRVDDVDWDMPVPTAAWSGVQMERCFDFWRSPELTTLTGRYTYD